MPAVDVKWADISAMNGNFPHINNTNVIQKASMVPLPLPIVFNMEGYKWITFLQSSCV
jgi:hypothetical protein